MLNNKELTPLDVLLSGFIADLIADLIGNGFEHEQLIDSLENSIAALRQIYKPASPDTGDRCEEETHL